MVRNTKFDLYELVEIVVNSSRYFVNLLSMHEKAIVEFLHVAFILLVKLAHLTHGGR